jgi:hypothetical protein
MKNARSQHSHTPEALDSAPRLGLSLPPASTLPKIAERFALAGNRVDIQTWRLVRYLLTSGIRISFHAEGSGSKKWKRQGTSGSTRNQLPRVSGLALASGRLPAGHVISLAIAGTATSPISVSGGVLYVAKRTWTRDVPPGIEFAIPRRGATSLTVQPQESAPKTRLATRFRREQARNNFSIQTWTSEQYRDTRGGCRCDVSESETRRGAASRAIDREFGYFEAAGIPRRDSCFSILSVDR